MQDGTLTQIMLGCCLWSWVLRQSRTQAAEPCLGHYNPQLHTPQEQLDSWHKPAQKVLSEQGQVRTGVN